jgi:hypothetical protein
LWFKCFFCILDYLSGLVAVVAKDVAENTAVIGTAETAEQGR